jgi:hypothetical protein
MPALAANIDFIAPHPVCPAGFDIAFWLCLWRQRQLLSIALVTQPRRRSHGFVQRRPSHRQSSWHERHVQIDGISTSMAETTAPSRRCEQTPCCARVARGVHRVIGSMAIWGARTGYGPVIPGLRRRFDRTPYDSWDTMLASPQRTENRSTTRRTSFRRSTSCNGCSCG